MAAPRAILVLSENWTLVEPRDLRAVVRIAIEAEEAGVDAVMVSEHVVLGPSADADGRMANPRDYAMPGNQDPRTPWPSSLVLLAAIAAATTRLRLVGAAVIAPLRHPLLLARELGTIDLLSEGRLVVQPIVSWHRPEYEALGVSWEARGELLDEHLAAWQALWRETPASFEGRHYRFADVYFEPKAYRPSGPRLWFGSTRLYPALLRRLVRYGSGFHPLGSPSDGELARIRRAMAEAGREPGELELVGGIRGTFAGPSVVADLDRALESVPGQLTRGFGSICFKPSQYTDEPAEVGQVCRRVVSRLEALAA